MKNWILLLFTFLVLVSNAQEEKRFAYPPADSRPWIFWDWMDDLVTKKGITSDLEHFKKFGVHGTLVMLVGGATGKYPMWEKHNMPDPVISQTSEFFDSWKFAAEESARLGLTISTQLGTGWTHSAGPWVKPHQAVQYLVFTEAGPLEGGRKIEAELARPGLGDFTADVSLVAFPDRVVVKPEEVIDLTGKLKGDKLGWDAPAGRWKIRRYAIKNARAYSHPQPKGGKGLESDKLDRDAVDAMFEGMVGRYLKNSPHLAGNTIRAFEADSWEVGNPDWSGKFKAEFIKRRGYDPTPWIITYKSDQIVGDADLTKRFLNDMYLTQTDLFAENFFDNLKDKATGYGMQFMTEPYMGPFDPIRMGGKTHIPMGEFWVDGCFMNSIRWASSSANTYGLKQVATEAFTGRWNDGNWSMDPYGLKRVGDLAFCNGANLMLLHGSALQPWGTDVKPGMPMFYWGTMFAPGQTWLEPGKAWINYIARCQYMLGQGKNVADVVGLMPTLEWATSMPAGLHKKYNYDLMSEETFLKELDWKDGYFHLPSGAKYRVLILPKTNGRMSAEIISKLTVLVEKGGTVVCQDKPFASHSLTNYPECDVEVMKLANKLWGKLEGKYIYEHKLGKGNFIWMNKIWEDTLDPENDYFRRTRKKNWGFYGKQPTSTTHWTAEFASLLNSFDKPDVEVLKAGGKSMAWGGFDYTSTGTKWGEDAISWIHRRDGDREIYFVSNQVASENEAEILFRVKDKLPEIWCAETGKRYRPEKWSKDGDRIKVTIPFTPYGSLFLVFQSGESEASANLPLYRPAWHVKAELPLEGSWWVSFPKGFGAPPSAQLSAGSWTESPEPGIKYFSGTASYQKTLNLDAKQLKSKIYLDLGTVRNIAEIIINDKVVDTLWKPPFRADISDWLKLGANNIKLKLTNTWWNRMVGDEQLPEDLNWGERVQYYENDYKGYPLKEIPEWVWSGKDRPTKERITFTTWKYVEKDSPLELAGLLGPVKLIMTDK